MLLFLLGAGRVVVMNWVREDGWRRAEAARSRPAPVWDTPAVLPSPESTVAALTEREHAARVFGAAAHVIWQFNPDITAMQVSSI